MRKRRSSAKRARGAALRLRQARASLGYSYNNNPINSRDVTLNILAPAVAKHHISGGLSYM
ncbi:hypothetical protein [Methylocystis iwaonis]|uniref:Uncharacterized protein n=1 Tax=Methylocystis iwaonis TaxID=2885079 RepID=A0ABM8E7G9_9HYPH|nr:hypothetical protein [Methylocystis iwaonis]BDV33844.1 hypothetical protein SS37A_13730 [Methylocystis iwaonis]